MDRTLPDKPILKERRTQQSASKFIAFELFMLSVYSLYLELLIIGWNSGQLRFFTLFDEELVHAG